MGGAVNKYEALCQLASDEQWCWRLFCTTCGHTNFRYAFREIAKGLSPKDKDWLVYTRFTGYRDTMQHKLLGPLPGSYSITEKFRILTICLDADILCIAENCRFPDWLGYLGLVLEHMKNDAIIYRLVSSKWASQMKQLVPEYSQIHSRLSEIAENDILLLNIKDLEAVEECLQNRYRVFKHP